MLPLEAGQGIHLIAMCLLNARTSQMSVAEIFEWLAQKYPEYQYTKYKIRKVLRHDSERICPRFVIANKSRLAGVPVRWTIRPGTEPQLRQRFSGPPTKRPIPQFYGGLSQVIHCVLCNRGFDCHESFVTHQREAHSSGSTMSPTVHEEMRGNVDTLAAIHESGTRTTSEAHHLDKLTNLEPVVGAEAETEFAMQGAGAIEGETLFVAETPTTTDGSRRYRNGEGELDNRENAGGSATEDETIGDAQIFEDAASHQMSDNDNSSVDSIRAEKQEDSRTYHFTHGMVTVKISPHRSRLRI
jgi:hypothetical protein